jgi:hypothetical protein
MPNLNRTRTATSARTNRSNSRPNTPNARPLRRLLSSQFPDDHSVYHDHEDERPPHIEADEPALRSTTSRESERREEVVSTSSGDSDSTPEDPEKEEKDNTTIVPENINGIPDKRDVEAGPPKLEKQKSSRSVKDPNLVGWEGPDDPANPKNWSMKRKWAATFIISSFTFVSPVSSSMISPALGVISKDFGITNTVEAQLTLSIFVLAYAIGPLFLGPLSEIYGRVLVLQLSNLFYLAWNLGCGFAQNSSQLMAFRFLSGLGGSAPLAIGGVSTRYNFNNLWMIYLHVVGCS